MSFGEIDTLNLLSEKLDKLFDDSQSGFKQAIQSRKTR